MLPLSDMIGGALTGGAAKTKTSDDGDSREPLVGGNAKSMQPVALFPLHDFLVGAEREANQSGDADLGARLQEKLELKHVGAWLLAIQTTAACVAAAVTSVLSPAWLPRDGKSVARTLLISAAVGAAALARPVLVVENQGVQTVAPLQRAYKSLRVALGFVLLGWISESLVHTECLAADATAPHHHVIGPLRHGILGAAVAIAVLCGFFRAAYPGSVSDLHVLVAMAALVVVIAAPQTLSWQEAPLTRPLSMVDGATRVCRVGAFALSYAATVLAVLPQRPFAIEPAVVSLRAFAATAWILVVDRLLVLGLAPLYLALLCVRRAGGASGVVAKGVRYNAVGDDETEPITGEPAEGVKICNLSEDRKRELIVRMGGALP